MSNSKLDGYRMRSASSRFLAVQHFLLVFVLLTGSIRTASASLISEDSAFGLHTITRDTNTGLEWVDLTLTQGQSINQVLAQLGPGQHFAGFHFASEPEVAQLFLDGGLSSFPLGSSPTSPGDLAAAQNLVSLLGETATVLQPDGTTVHFTQGFAPGTVPGVGPGDTYFVAWQSNNTASAHFVNVDFANLDDTFSNVGTFLVRDSISGVAEPSTWAMLLIGFAGIGLTLYRRRGTFALV